MSKGTFIDAIEGANARLKGVADVARRLTEILESRAARDRAWDEIVNLRKEVRSSKTNQSKAPETDGLRQCATELQKKLEEREAEYRRNYGKLKK